MKLRPEQQKLWRKTFHQERDRGVEPRIAGERADEAVKVWDERGAFDENAHVPLAFTFDDGRICAWITISTRAEGCTLFAGDVVCDKLGYTWTVADTALYRDGALVRIMSRAPLSESPRIGDTMTFNPPRPGCSTDAIYSAGVLATFVLR